MRFFQEKCSCMIRSAVPVFKEGVIHAHCLKQQVPLTPPRGGSSAGVAPLSHTEDFRKTCVPTSLSTPKPMGQEPGGSQWKQWWAGRMDAERRGWMSARNWGAEKGNEHHKPRTQLERENEERSSSCRCQDWGSHHIPQNPGTEWLKSFQIICFMGVYCTIYF